MRTSKTKLHPIWQNQMPKKIIKNTFTNIQSHAKGTSDIFRSNLDDHSNYLEEYILRTNFTNIYKGVSEIGFVTPMLTLTP